MAKFFIDRPVFAWVIAIMIMLGGFISIKLIAVEQYPDIAPPAITVTAVYPGADAQTIENTVTQIIEQSLTGLDKLLYMKSTSSAQGVVQITLSFDTKADPDLAQVQILNKIESIKSRLPSSVQKNGITVSKNNPNFLKVISFYSDDPTKSEAEIADFVYSTVQEPMKRVQGVGDTMLFGAEYAMRIWLDPSKLTYYKLSTNEIIAAIQAQNAQVTAGQLGSNPVIEGQQLNATITAQSRLNTPTQFENILLRVNSDGAKILLKDVAKVELGSSDYNMISTYNGKYSAGLAIYLAAGANQLETAQGVDDKLNELAKIFPDDMHFTYTYDTTPFVKLSINNVIQTLIEAIILVVIVMYVFLQNVRATIIPTITVPIVLLGTIAVLYALGFTINTLSMFAMVLAIGLLVDDTIVVIENVERLMHDEGLSPYDATVKSMSQITSALIGIAVVLSAVFIPMALISGAAGIIFRQFSITIVTSMALSVVMALVLTPALCVQILKPKLAADENQKKSVLSIILSKAPFTWIRAILRLFFRGFNSLFTKSSLKYEIFTRKMLKHWVVSLFAYAAFIFLLFLSFGKLSSSFLPNEDQGMLIMSVELPAGSTLAQTQKVLADASAHIRQSEDFVDAVFTISGFSFTGRGQNMGMGFVKLKDWKLREAKGQDIDSISRRINGYFYRVTEARSFVLNLPPIPALGMASGFSYMLKDSSGEGHDALMRTLFQMLAMASQNPNLMQVRPAGMLDVPQYKINVDFEKAQTLGLSVNSINSVLSVALGGAYIDDFVYKNRVKKVYMQGDAPYRMLPEHFEHWNVQNNKGDMVPYSAFATTTKSYGSPSLVRFNGVSAFGISGAPASGQSTGQAMQIMEELSQHLPKGYSFEWTDASYQEKQAGSMIIVLYLITALIIFLSLAALYESWKVPFSVLFVIPVGVLGTAIAAVIFGLDNDIYFKVGLLTTMGLAAKNAILIVEFAKDAFENHGKSLIDATLEACRLRLRPIMMTSFAFILGVLPLALSTGAGSAGQQAVGLGVIGGMVSATFLAIFFAPLFFVLINGSITKRKKA